MSHQARFGMAQRAGANVVEVAGEIDLVNIAEFRTCLERAAAADRGGIIVDFAQVTYFDSRTVAALADFAKRMLTNRQRLSLVAPQGSRAERILSIAGLGLVIEMHATVDEALEAAREA